MISLHTLMVPKVLPSQYRAFAPTKEREMSKYSAHLAQGPAFQTFVGVPGRSWFFDSSCWPWCLEHAWFMLVTSVAWQVLLAVVVSLLVSFGLLAWLGRSHGNQKHLWNTFKPAIFWTVPPKPCLLSVGFVCSSGLHHLETKSKCVDHKS